ncbi:hypothetical protein CPB85DRAFT_1256232 [Mucidula mucida]|nr:hypothetical protein CPB85DRAFT_1256232 [Mucidula mucida]
MDPPNLPETIAQALNTPLASYHSSHDSAAATSVLMASLKKPTLPEIVTGSKRMFETVEETIRPKYRIHKLFQGSSQEVKNAVAAILSDATDLLEAMHLAPALNLLRLQSMSNMAIAVAEPVWKASNVGCPISSAFTEESRRIEIEKIRSHNVDSLAEVRDLGTATYMERMTTSFASAIAGHSARAHTTGFLKNSNTPVTVRPGCGISSKTSYTSVDYDMPGVDPSNAIRKPLEQGLKAMQRLDLTDFHIQEVLAVADPLNSDFPIYVISLMAKHGIPLHSFRCKGRGDPHYFCGSEQCTDDLGRFTVTGRATGVDATCTLALLRQALKTDAPDLPITEEQIMLISLLLLLIWTRLVASNATYFVLNGVNKEMFFIRDRRLQILWNSDVLDISRAAIPGPSTIATHVGFKLQAFNDAFERGLMDKDLLEQGALPVTFRQKIDITIDSLNSPLDFSALSLLYKVSAGAFLPSACSDGSYTTSQTRTLFEDALYLKLYWDDAVDLTSIVTAGDVKSPLTLVLGQETGPTENQKRLGITLHAKIHCQKLHGTKAFLAHLIYDGSVPILHGKPYGKSFLLKLHENSEVILREVKNLKYLGGDAEIAARIPKVFSLTSNRDRAVTASIMKHFDGCYPLAIADRIGSLGSDMHTWMTQLSVKYKAAHNGLQGHNVLFDPLNPKCFYVVEWGSAVVLDDSVALSEHEKLNQLIKSVTKRKKVNVPGEKRARHK